MSPPIDHHMTLTDRNGKIVHGRVVYTHPIAAHSTEVHIETNDWLDAHRYPVTYRTPTQSARGFYVVVDYASVDGQWLFKGVFDAA
jgi:hypothetical protein